MKNKLQVILLVILGLAISYQVYIYLIPKKSNRPIIPDISLTLLDNSSTTVSKIGEGKHTIVFLVRSNCDFCKKEIKEVREKLDLFVNTEILFVSFESIDVIGKFKKSYLPDQSPFITFAKAKQAEVEEFMEQDLVYPYMFWFDNQGVQKAQHMGLFPISRVIEVIEKSS